MILSLSFCLFQAIASDKVNYLTTDEITDNMDEFSLNNPIANIEITNSYLKQIDLTESEANQ